MQSWGEQLLIKVIKENRMQDFKQLPERFFAKHEKEIFDYTKDYVEEYNKLPSFALVKRKLKLKDELPDEPYSFFLNEVKSRTLFFDIQDIQNDIKKIVDKRTMKAMTKAIDRMSKFVQSDNTSVLMGNRGITTMQELGMELITTISEQMASTGLTGVPSGWPTLDKQTGGFQKGDVYVVLARPKMGKSMSTIYFADHAHVNNFVPLFISMEMKEIAIAKRYFAKKANMNMTTMKTGLVSTYGMEHLTNVVNTYQNTQPFYFIEGQFKKGIDEVERQINYLKPHIVYIDAAYLLKLSRFHKLSKWELTTEIAEAIKTIATITDLPIVVSFQFTKKVKKGAVTAELGDAQLSDAIAQIASVGIGIFNDDNPHVIDVTTRRKITIIGDRDGEEGDSFYINWLWDSMNFDEVEFNY